MSVATPGTGDAPGTAPPMWHRPRHRAPEPVSQARHGRQELLPELHGRAVCLRQIPLKPEGCCAQHPGISRSSTSSRKMAAPWGGYTDRIGSDAYNLKLSEAHCPHRGRLPGWQGLPAGKVSIEGRGEANPVTGTQWTGASRQGSAGLPVWHRSPRRSVTGVQEVQQ